MIDAVSRRQALSTTQHHARQVRRNSQEPISRARLRLADPSDDKVAARGVHRYVTAEGLRVM